MENKQVLTLDDVKDLIKIDRDFEKDDMFISIMLGTAREYIENAIGYCDEELASIKLLISVICNKMYKTRSMTVEKDEKVQAIIKNIIFQQQLKNLDAGGEVDEQGD